MARLRRMEWGCGRAPGGPDRAGAPEGDGGKSGGRPGNAGSVAGGLPAGRDGWKADGQSRDVPEGSGKPCRHLCAPFLPGFWLGGRFFRRIRAGSASTRCRALRQMARCASDLQPADAVPVCQGRVSARSGSGSHCTTNDLHVQKNHTNRPQISPRLSHGATREATGRPAEGRACAMLRAKGLCQGGAATGMAGRAGPACRHRASAPGIRGCCRGRR